MSGLRHGRHGHQHREGGPDPIEFPVAAASSLQWATAGQSGPTDVPSGVTTNVGFDEDSLSTNAPSVFTLEDDGAGTFGLMINENGSYFPWWSAQVVDVAGHRISSPETITVGGDAQSGTSSALVFGTLLGSLYARGFAVGSGAEWDLSWSQPFVVNDGISTVSPIPMQIHQNTGETLRAYGDILVLKLSDDISF